MAENNQPPAPPASGETPKRNSMLDGIDHVIATSALPPDTPDALRTLVEQAIEKYDVRPGSSNNRIVALIRELRAALALSRGQTPEPQVNFKQMLRDEIACHRAYAESTTPHAGMTTPDQHRHTAGVLNVMLDLIEFKESQQPPAEEPRRAEPPKEDVRNAEGRVFAGYGLSGKPKWIEPPRQKETPK